MTHLGQNYSLKSNYYYYIIKKRLKTDTPQRLVGKLLHAVKIRLIEEASVVGNLSLSLSTSLAIYRKSFQRGLNRGNLQNGPEERHQSLLEEVFLSVWKDFCYTVST